MMRIPQIYAGLPLLLVVVGTSIGYGVEPTACLDSPALANTTVEQFDTDAPPIEMCADQPDIAQQTLDEDWLLHPAFGNAALHLDVPYSAEVTVRHPIFRCQEFLVRSQGSHRDLLLTNVPMEKRWPFVVNATWQPRGEEHKTSLIRTVDLQAGDRRHLTIREEEFKKDTTRDVPAVSFVATMAPAAAGADKAKKKRVKKGPAKDKKEVTCHCFKFAPVELTAFVAYPKEAVAGGKAQSFTFAKAGKTPDLQLIHEPPTLDLKQRKDSRVKVTLWITWDGLEEPVEVSLCDMTLKFKYDDATKQGVAALCFNGDGDSALRKKVELEIPKVLSVIDRPKTMEMTGELEFEGFPHPVGSALRIKILEGEPKECGAP